MQTKAITKLTPTGPIAIVDGAWHSVNLYNGEIDDIRYKLSPAECAAAGVTTPSPLTQTKPNKMNILHTLTVSNTVTGEQSTRQIIRSRRLTYRGAERILRRNGMSTDLTVVRLETAILA